MQALFPIQLNLADKPCLVVGAGRVALRKVQSLLECGARVHVVGIEAVEEIEALAAANKLTFTRRGYVPTDLEGATLVICATANKNVNRRVARDCTERNILVNVVDDANVSSFIVPAVMRQGDLTVSVSTNGRSPLLAGKLCRRLKKELGPEYGIFLQMMGEVRQQVIDAFPDPEQRKRVFVSMIESGAIDLLRQGDETKAKERIAACISSQ